MTRREPSEGPPSRKMGTTLVVSPLIALMEDQVAKLAALGLRAERIHSGRDRADSRRVCGLYLDGRLDYLFIAPERLSVPLGRPVVEHGVTYRYFPRQTRFYNASLPLTTWLWKAVPDYQLVHIHALFSYSSTVSAWMARRKHVPYVIRPLGILNQWGMENRRSVLKKPRT